jgi:hypothetical protein
MMADQNFTELYKTADDRHAPTRKNKILNKQMVLMLVCDRHCLLRVTTMVLELKSTAT